MSLITYRATIFVLAASSLHRTARAATIKGRNSFELGLSAYAYLISTRPEGVPHLLVAGERRISARSLHQVLIPMISKADSSLSGSKEHNPCVQGAVDRVASSPGPIQSRRQVVARHRHISVPHGATVHVSHQRLLRKHQPDHTPSPPSLGNDAACL